MKFAGVITTVIGFSAGIVYKFQQIYCLNAAVCSQQLARAFLLPSSKASPEEVSDAETPALPMERSRHLSIRVYPLWRRHVVHLHQPTASVIVPAAEMAA